MTSCSKIIIPHGIDGFLGTIQKNEEFNPKLNILQRFKTLLNTSRKMYHEKCILKFWNQVVIGKPFSCHVSSEDHFAQVNQLRRKPFISV